VTPAPKKWFGQNFLTDEETARTVTRVSSMGKGDHVVEVGPGQGFMTRFLLESGAFVTAVEKDPELPALLEERFAGHPLRVLHGDFMEVDLHSLSPSPFILVGNLPYYVSVAILGKALAAPRGLISQMVFMFQKEVALRLVARPGSDEFGMPSVMAQLTHGVSMVRKVPAGSFFPKPKVDSALVHLRPLNDPLVEESERSAMLDWAGSAFRYRRKTLRNALVQSGVDSMAIDEATAAVGIRPVERLEDVPLPTLVSLWRLLGR